AAATAGLLVLFALLVLGGVMGFRFRVEVAGGEDDFLAVGAKIDAGRLADARADADGPARRQVLYEDLIERVAGALLLGLEDDLRPVRREVALAGADVI